MNCLYLTLFFILVAGIAQTFIKPWNQLLYPRVIEVCHLLFEPRHDFILHLIIIAWIQECGEKPCFVSSHNEAQKLIPFLCAAREKLQPFRFVTVR